MADPERRKVQRRQNPERRVVNEEVKVDRRRVGRRRSVLKSVERREGKPDPAGLTILLNETQMGILDNFAGAMGMSREYAVRFWIIDDIVRWRDVMGREGTER